MGNALAVDGVPVVSGAEAGAAPTYADVGVDVQIMLEGSEEIAWKEIKELKEAVPYDEEKDMARYNGTFEHQIMINKGMFWVAFPQDGHKSVSHSKEPHNFEKIILKLPVK